MHSKPERNGYISRAFIDGLLTRVDIVEIINERVPLKKQGGNFVACCPFHTEKTPSFSVTQSKQFFHCFGCGEHGNAIGFLMEFDRLSFVEAVEALAATVQLEVVYESKSGKPVARQQLSGDYEYLDKVVAYYQSQLKGAKVAVDYLKGRGLSGEIAKRYAIGFAPDDWHYLEKHFSYNTDAIKSLVKTGMLIQKNGKVYTRFRERVMFPIRDQRGRVLGFGGRSFGDEQPKYLNSPDTVIFHKGQELYGLYEALQVERRFDVMFVVEGYMDVIALAQHGIHNVVATLGTATTKEHLQRLFRASPKVIFCFDGDDAGRAAAWRALQIALTVIHAGVQAHFMFLPQGDDPDSFVRRESKDTFLQNADKAQSFDQFLISYLSSQVDMNDTSGRAKLVDLARPLIASLQDDVLRQMLVNQISEIVGLTSEKLEVVFSQAAKKKTVTKQQERSKSISPLRTAVTLLIQVPELAQRFKLEDLQVLKEQSTASVGIKLLLEMFEILHERPQLNTGALMEYWRDKREYNYLSALAVTELHIPNDGIAAEFEGATQCLLRAANEFNLDRLMLKLKQGEISSQERIQLQTLISKQKNKTQNV